MSAAVVGGRFGPVHAASSARREGRGQTAPVGGSDVLDATGQPLPQVEAVADLHGPGGAGGDALPVCQRAVTADDLDAGMLTKPAAELFGVPSLPKRERQRGGGVDQKGPVGIAVEGEVVHAQHPRSPLTQHPELAPSRPQQRTKEKQCIQGRGCSPVEAPPPISPAPATSSVVSQRPSHDHQNLPTNINVRGRTYPRSMTHNVLHRGYGITIDLSASDLGNPDHPGLLQEIHRNYKPDLLYCLGAHEYGTVCPGFMTIVEKNGRYHARHVTRGEVSETAGESELHKALKNHTAEAASREGFNVCVEDRAVHGRRRTDVTVAGASGKKIGYEIQISPIASGSVDNRTRTAVDDGLTPLWLVTNENSLAIDRAPWARPNVQRWQDVGSRDALRVRGGVKALRMVRCDWSTQRECPRRERAAAVGTPRGNQPQAHYDDMVRMTATGERLRHRSCEHEQGGGAAGTCG